jgi:hypothetical protein
MLFVSNGKPVILGICKYIPQLPRKANPTRTEIFILKEFNEHWINNSAICQ